VHSYCSSASPHGSCTAHSARCHTAACTLSIVLISTYWVFTCCNCTHLHRVLITTCYVLLLRAGIANALKRNADIAQALKMAGTAAKLAVQRVAPVGHSKASSNTVGNSGDTEGGEGCLMSHV
jgi:hypothetical protein